MQQKCVVAIVGRVKKYCTLSCYIIINNSADHEYCTWIFYNYKYDYVYQWFSSMYIMDLLVFCSQMMPNACCKQISTVSLTPTRQIITAKNHYLFNFLQHHLSWSSSNYILYNANRLQWKIFAVFADLLPIVKVSSENFLYYFFGKMPTISSPALQNVMAYRSLG